MQPRNDDGLFTDASIASLLRRDREDHADVLRLTPGWCRLGFWLLLAAVLLAGVGLARIRVPRVVRVPAVVESRAAGLEFLAPAPRGATGAIEPGASVSVRLDGDPSRELPSRLLGVAEPVEAEQRKTLAEFGIALPQPLVMRGDVSGGESTVPVGRARATVELTVGEEPLLVRIMPGSRGRHD